MMHNLTPLYLSSLIPQSVSNLSRYNLRNANDLQTIDARTQQYYQSFLSSTTRDWNALSLEAKQSDSVHSFKRYLAKDNTSVPYHFYIGSRQSQILHTRLQTNCKRIFQNRLCAVVAVLKMCSTSFSIADTMKHNVQN